MLPSWAWPRPPSDSGYWLVASDGGIFAYGDAGFYGSHRRLPPQPAHRGHGRHPRRGGYWLVASDGGIFTYGDAGFYGSHRRLPPQPAHRGHGRHPRRRGYWLVASDGGIFAYGDAGFYGSTGGSHLNQPIVGMASTADGGGY